MLRLAVLEAHAPRKILDALSIQVLCTGVCRIDGGANLLQDNVFALNSPLEPEVAPVDVLGLAMASPQQH